MYCFYRDLKTAFHLSSPNSSCVPALLQGHELVTMIIAESVLGALHTMHGVTRAVEPECHTMHWCTRQGGDGEENHRSGMRRDRAVNIKGGWFHNERGG
jgi:hypothetical protein